ncbi:MAG: hypothetical protein M1337_01730 [Actinobacteria bacterium]|nr:hypothetical protein [Actinomycetota bacterium]
MRRWLLRIALIVVFVGVLALVVTVLHSTDVLSATKSEQVPPLRIENVASYWFGPAASYAKPGPTAAVTAPKLIMRGSSFDKNVEDDVLAGFVLAYNDSRTTTWSYTTPPQIIFTVDLKDGSRVTGALSPTTERHPSHAEIVVTPAKGSSDKAVTYRVDSPTLAQAVSVMLAFEQGAGLMTTDASANPTKSSTTTTTKKN